MKRLFISAPSVGGVGVSAGKWATATLRRSTDAGATWSTVRSAAYTYYDGTTANGNAGDLQTATVTDADGSAIGTEYYRYYTGDSSIGYTGGLKYSLAQGDYQRATAAGVDPLTATDAQLAPYASTAYQYNAAHQVTQAIMQGQGCSSCSGGLGAYNYSYTLSMNPDGYNAWRTKTVETLPDGNQSIVYTN